MRPCGGTSVPQRLYPSDHRLRDPDGLFCSQAGAGVFSAGAGKSTDIGSRGDADATIAACTKLIYETPLGASQAAAYIARGLFETIRDADVPTPRSVRAQRCRCEIAGSSC